MQGFGIDLHPGIISDFMQALFGVNPQEKQLDQSVNVMQEEKCEGCGMTFSEIQKAGRLGCSQCYEKFEFQMRQLLRRIQGGGTHVGKIPLRGGAKIKNKFELEKLKKSMKELVECEKFEEAAVVRDQIKEIEENTGGAGNES